MNNKLSFQKKIKTAIYLFLVVSVNIIAQNSNTQNFLPNIVPPSPNSYKLGNYGNVPVGLFTGATNISIPLLTFKTKDLESPLSLYYGSNGIKVDEVSSNVGLGWNLNCGGVITRTVRDKNDDKQAMIYPPANLETISEVERIQFYNAAGDSSADTESDIFSFNFNGNSGKFVYDKSGIPVLINNQKIKIERFGIINEDFVITAANGVKYYFTEKETTTFRSQGAGHSNISGSVTSWYLSKILHPNKTEMYFTYESSDMDYTVSKSQSLTMTPYFQPGCNSQLIQAPHLSEIAEYNMRVIGKRISGIYSSNPSDGYLNISYSPKGAIEEVEGNSQIKTIILYNSNQLIIEKINFNYFKTINSRVFLQNITFNDITKKYAFEYNNQSEFPERLSKSQDHWGYYNGKFNTNLVPKNIYAYGLNDIDYNGADKEPNAQYAQIGLLRKIIYPTQGFTEFTYESNTYWGEKILYPQKTKQHLERHVDDTSTAGTIYTITSTIDQRIKFNGNVQYQSMEAPRYDMYGNIIPDPKNTGHFGASLQISCNDNPTEFLPLYVITEFGTPLWHDNVFTFIKTTNELHENIFYFDAKAGKTYKIFFYKNGLRSSAIVDFNYYASTPIASYIDLETGGVRIKSTKDYLETNGKTNYKRYYYANKNDITHSSGNKGKSPLYVDLTMERVLCEKMNGPWGNPMCNYLDTHHLTISSSSMVSLFDTSNNNCFYKYVTVSEGGDNFENGGEMKEFIINRDDFGNPILDTDIKSAPLTNFGWNNGLEIKSEIFQKKIPNQPFVMVQETENNYKLDPSTGMEIKSYCVRKNYEEPCPAIQTVLNLSIVEYKNITYWFYLESSVTKKYDSSGLNPTETAVTYQYNNPTHMQLTAKRTKSSVGKILYTKYFYPQDPIMVNEPFVTEMIRDNKIDIPLKTETYEDDIKLSEQTIEYAQDDKTSNLLLPRYVYANKGTNTIDLVKDKKISFDKYDSIGNVEQYTPENGTPVSIIWGYNKTQPIAKLENATYTQVSSYLANLQSAESTGNERALITVLNTLRENLPNAMVTTYTYIPLVGVSTITDPKGQITTYDYDSFGRLQFVKDAQGNLLIENQYNYKK